MYVSEPEGCILNARQPLLKRSTLYKICIAEPERRESFATHQCERLISSYPERGCNLLCVVGCALYPFGCIFDSFHSLYPILYPFGADTAMSTQLGTVPLVRFGGVRPRVFDLVYRCVYPVDSRTVVNFIKNCRKRHPAYKLEL